MERVVPDIAWKALAEALSVEVAALRAVADVESAGEGFLPPPSELPKVLFEGHAFHRLTQGRFDAVEPTLSFRRWTRRHYATTPAGEWDRLNRACVLDRPAALQSASWGAFQIMGFNYAACGFTDIESFVSAESAGASQQLETFARFLSQAALLGPLRARQWRAFARAYNGPGYRRNRYDTRLREAYARWSRALAGAGRRRTRADRVVRTIARPAAPRPRPGRVDFSQPATSGQRAAPRRRRKATETRHPRHVQPDPVDLRDWVYRPSVTTAPALSLMPHDLCVVKDQGDTSACTGFSLATVIEYLLDRANRPSDEVSGFMLYSMARRYDEWTDNDTHDEGSSLRGALKGWARHGASAGRLWKKMSMPTATLDPDSDWWLDGVKRPIGAYYRLDPASVTDMHVALNETGVLYASALTHGGWDQLYNEHITPPPTSPDDLPIVDCRKGAPEAGHAFAIIGYTEKGFVVQNSWSRAWGRGGTAVLTYSDWKQNAMDCWVVQLGVVTREHEEVARAVTLRTDGPAGRVVLSSNEQLALHEISPFIVDMVNEGRLSDRGQFRTGEGDLALLLDHHLPEARRRWGVGRSGVIDVAIYAHGGLVPEESAAATARTWIPLLYSNRIFPVFLMWETGALSSVFNLVEDALRGDEPRIAADWWDRFRARLWDWKDERIEGLTRRPGGKLWRQIKDNARDLSATRVSGVVKLFRLFDDPARRRAMPKVRLHLIGHSAGGVVQAYLAARANRLGFDIGSLSLLAPAVRVDVFDEQLRTILKRTAVRTLIAHLTDTAEMKDSTCKPYGHSLLYLVSRAFEDAVETPILGMEKHLVPAIVTRQWGSLVSRLACPGGTFRPGDRLTTADTHGGLDSDPAVQDAVVRHIKGRRFEGEVVGASI